MRVRREPAREGAPPSCAFFFATMMYSWRKNTGCNVWAASKNFIPGTRECIRMVTYFEAQAYCDFIAQESGDNGVRLCTVQELQDGCTDGTGCGISHEYIWTNN